MSPAVQPMPSPCKVFLDSIYQYLIYLLSIHNKGPWPYDRKRNDLPKDAQRLSPLTPAVFFILLALAEGERHGYAIMQGVASLSDNRVRMGPGTLYTTIQRLLDQLLIEETQGTGEPADHESRRRYYKLTRTGKSLLASEIDRMESLLRRVRQKKLIPKGTG